MSSRAAAISRPSPQVSTPKRIASRLIVPDSTTEAAAVPSRARSGRTGSCELQAAGRMERGYDRGRQHHAL